MAVLIIVLAKELCGRGIQAELVDRPENVAESVTIVGDRGGGEAVDLEDLAGEFELRG
ncbi:MAG: hypothetical protein ACE5QF_01485 [Thermoplasmata archaeon]